MPKRIGLLTGGGHVSCFHAGMWGVVEKAHELGYEVLGLRDGYRGAAEGDALALTLDQIEPHKAGSLLGSSRHKADIEAIGDRMKRLGIDALVVMGGNDHLSEAARLDAAGVPVVGWPKTMDNDLSGTFFCLGFQTAGQVAARSIAQSHADAATNRRVHLTTLFGRDTDWVAACAAAWGAADVVLPAEKYVEDVDKKPYHIEQVHDAIVAACGVNEREFGRRFAVVAVSEGADVSGLASHLREDEIDAHGNPKIEPMKLALVLKDALKEISGGKLKAAIDCVSYAMRNGPPGEIDLTCAIAAGRRAVEAIHRGECGNSVVITRDLSTSIAPLLAVSKQRFMRPENHLDYEAMKPRDSLVEHYRPLFGEAPTKAELLYRI